MMSAWIRDRNSASFIVLCVCVCVCARALLCFDIGASIAAIPDCVFGGLVAVLFGGQVRLFHVCVCVLAQLYLFILIASRSQSHPRGSY